MKKFTSMLPVVLLWSLFLFPINGISADRPIIIDHTCTDIRQIPQWAIEQAKSTLHIAYGHTSHGSQLISGMGSSGTQLDTFMTSNGAPPGLYVWHDGPQAGALDLDDYFASGDLGNPDRVTWAQLTRNYLNNPANADVNVVIWSWCGQVDGTAADINTYLNLMSQLETEYPHVSFIYMTGHLNGTGASGNVNVRNNQIRNYCVANNKILYDFADIESYDSDGLLNYMALFANDNCDYDSDGNGTLDRNWALDWQNSHTLGVDWWMSGAAHSQHLNGNRKGYAAWWLWATLAGWNQCVPAPSGLSLTANSDLHEIVLQWTDNSAATNEDAFIISRQVDGGAWDNNYASVGNNITTFTDPGLLPGTYVYRLTAFLADNGNGNPCQSGPSNPATGIIVSQDPPAQPTNLTGSASSTTRAIHLTWTDNANNETGFVLERKIDSGNWNLNYATLAANSTSFDDLNLSPGTYVYSVRAYNQYGDSASSSETGNLMILNIPAPPTNLSAAGNSVNGTVSLAWTDNSNNESQFVIARRVNSGTWNNAYDTVGANVTSYTDNNKGAPPLPNATYAYRVSGANSDGASTPSNEASAVISSSEPLAPSNLDSTLNGFDITLTWTDNSSNEECFILERQIDSGGFVLLAASISANSNSYLDASLEPYHTYTYRVKAKNNTGESPYSNETFKYIAEATSTITLKQNVNGYIGCRDAYLDATNPTLNFGNDPYNYVRNNTKINFLISFDLPAEVMNKRIIEARIGVYCWTVSSYTPGQYLDLYKVTETWIEGTADGAYQEGSASWNVRCCADLWTTPGGTTDPQVLGRSLIPNSAYYPEFDITGLVQQWVDGPAVNFGVLLKNDSTVVTGIKASEYSEYGRPYLVITYANKTSCNLTVSSTGGGSVTQPGEGVFTYDEGTVVDLMAVPESGYQFVRWTGDVADPDSAFTSVTLDADKAVIAIFDRVIERFDLTISSSSGGSVTQPGEGMFSFDSGTVVNLAATPDSGYEFVIWTGDVANFTSPTTTVTMDGDKTVYANFDRVIPDYTLTISNSTGGSVTTPGEGSFIYKEGTTVNLVAVAESGYQFVSWTGDVDNPNSATANVTMNSDKSVSASFARRTMYVADIAMSVISSSGGKFARAVVTVRDNQGNPVSGAGVKGAWSGLVTGGGTKTTNAEGRAVFNSKKTNKKGTITITVTGVSAAGYIYNPSQNVETQDSISIQ